MWPKIALLYTSCNGVAAVVCGSLVVPVVSFLLVPPSAHREAPTSPLTKP